jgi:hypothetical protein
MTNITIFCAFHRGKVDTAFAMIIDKDKLVYDLKEEIQKSNPIILRGVDFKLLSLWKVNIPANTNLQMLMLREDDDNGFERMLPNQNIGRYFPDELAKECIHVVIERPSGIIFLLF